MHGVKTSLTVFVQAPNLYVVIVNRFNLLNHGDLSTMKWESVRSVSGEPWPNPNRVQMTFTDQSDAIVFYEEMKGLKIFAFRNWQ